MKYFTFLPQFHPLIIAETKRMTIRQRPKLNPGDRFALRYWTGKAYRSPMGTLGTATCRRVIRLHIATGGALHTPAGWEWKIPDDIARLDGFADGAAMLEHFLKAHGLPFDGWAHMWTDFKAA